MPRYAIIVEYIGTRYFGSQIQPNTLPESSKNIITVQDELEKAIRTLTKTKIKTIFSGRTDAGVHSKGQVVHFDYEQELDLNKTLFSLNGLLPSDISVRDLKKVGNTFHAQRSAKARYYRYTIANRPFRSAWDEHCLLVKKTLNVDEMNEALGFLLGEHDFSSFKKVRTSNPAKVCNMYKASAVKNGEYIYIDFIADRFLYNMIRLIVGTLLYMQRNSLAPYTLKEILDAKDNRKAGAAVSPEGLTLMEVIYNNINGDSK